MIRRRIYEILEVADPTDRTSGIVHAFIFALILGNVLAVVLESVESIRVELPGFFHWFEVFSVAVFTIEYALRIWSCTTDQRYASPLGGRLKFALTPLAVVDFFAIAPFYFPLVAPDLRVLRAMRLLRITRVLRFGRYSEAFRVLGGVIHAKREELIASLTVLTALLVIASTLMYEAEHVVQPDKFPNIPAAMWWALITLTTVGYGDVFPVTTLGKILGATIAVFAIGMVALPTAILGAGFLEALQAKRASPRACPHCGKPIETVRQFLSS